MEFDEFLCCSQDDYDIAFSIPIFLEENNCRVRYHHRDFELGQTIYTNICKAITESKRTLFDFENICSELFLHARV